MRTLRIRTVTLLGLALILSLPWIFYVSAHFLETKTLSVTNHPQNPEQQQNLTETMQWIERNANRWTDPSWQDQLRSRLRQAGIDAAILTESGQEIYSSDPERKRALKSTEQFSVIQDGKVLGRVLVFLPNARTVQMIAALAGLLLAFIIIGYEMRRMLLKPLERMGSAARQIAEGELDVRLPESRIAEIAEVRDGFEVMVKGLQQSFQKQRELEEERRFVIAAVAHDLRTPLFALRGYLDGLEQGIARSPDKMAAYLKVCKDKSAQLDRLVEDLFTFTKTEYAQAEIVDNAIDLKLLLLRSIESLSPLAQQKHISLIANHLADDCIIMGDTHLLERAMNNLLDNAVRHTPPYGKIYVQCAKEGHKATFAIRDTGSGFTSEELERVFEPLYRGEASRNRSTGGAGLGLTISRKIVRRHGGELIATNHAYGGALLSGWMPAAKQGENDIQPN
ncbi:MULTISPECIES: cell wall metabolism sensor histidine kinase WalK [unclassified Paenibacillus]|uniref:sensor histidine kinase n=1 Tax=unclassified Paenibacillus TaxID=185978 RepID=UPI001C0F9148|nr:MULTISPECIES: HAMP domain-containing sensor histidine kinase [unclassified Paenibacillus]MBU5442925.1 HAMP domain-containing histidine kinase [Paenibacillus sp. MSJ-34]